MLRLMVAASLVVIFLALLLTPTARAQSGGPSLKKSTPPAEGQPTKNSKPPTPAPTPIQNDGPEETETISVETNLVTIPVIVSDRSDKYIGDLRQDEFKIYEDGVEQKVAYFDTVSAPFLFVLMLDTSASTQEKIGLIQRAAISFTEELQPQDRVKVVSFDDQVRDLCDFSSDRAVLQWAIKGTQPGKGTKLYDAVALAINKLRSIKGRKAIVIFTDGVDMQSDRATYDQNRKAIQEAGIIVYPIRFDTREDTERLVRQQQRAGQLPDLATILGGSGGTPPTTPKTFPSEDDNPLPIPTSGTGGAPGIPGILGKIRVTRDDPNPNPRDTRDPNNRDTGSSRDRDARFPDRQPGRNDSISAQLDTLYATGDAYLDELATETGGVLYRADTLFYLPDAFANIAAELRTQYSVGYYPSQTTRDGKYHKISVKTTRKDVSVRARPGYRARTSVK